MPAFCSVIGCSKRAKQGDSTSFFRIPAAYKDRGEYLNALSRERRESWIKALGRGNLSETTLKNARVCSNHFIYGAPAQMEDKTNPDWIPTQNMGHSNSQNTCKIQNAVKRPRMDEEEELLSTNLKVEDRLEEIEYCTVEVQTDLDLDKLNSLFQHLDYSNEKIRSLQEKVKRPGLSEESFRNDDAKTAYFTGFPKANMLFSVFKTISADLSTKASISPFQQFLLTLMRLRLNLPLKYLSYRFSISLITASDIFNKCLDILYSRYKKLIEWPSKESFKKDIPTCFKDIFGDNLAVIIDCIEIFTETSSGLLDEASSVSDYKLHQIIKFLIGFSPQGTILYISEAWSAKTTDQFLAERCGILNFISCEDIILANKGFCLDDSDKAVGDDLDIQIFTKCENQLQPTDFPGNIAPVRKYVEGAKDTIKKKFTICQGPIPFNMLSISKDGLSVMDKVLIVCSALVNFCSSYNSL